MALAHQLFVVHMTLSFCHVSWIYVLLSFQFALLYMRLLAVTQFVLVAHLSTRRRNKTPWYVDRMVDGIFFGSLPGPPNEISYICNFGHVTGCINRRVTVEVWIHLRYISGGAYLSGFDLYRWKGTQSGLLMIITNFHWEICCGLLSRQPPGIWTGYGALELIAVVSVPDWITSDRRPGYIIFGISSASRFTATAVAERWYGSTFWGTRFEYLSVSKLSVAVTAILMCLTMEHCPGLRMHVLQTPW